MDYRGHHLCSEPFHGENAQRLAWDSFLAKLVEVVRANPQSRFIWRVEPSLISEHQFEHSYEESWVYGRVTEVVGEEAHVDR